LGFGQHGRGGRQFVRLHMPLEFLAVAFERFQIELPIATASSGLGVGVKRLDQPQGRAEPAIPRPLGGAIEPLFTPLPIAGELFAAFDHLPPQRLVGRRQAAAAGGDFQQFRGDQHVVVRRRLPAQRYQLRTHAKKQCPDRAMRRLGRVKQHAGRLQRIVLRQALLGDFAFQRI
jgi:hypothetical protein